MENTMENKMERALRIYNDLVGHQMQCGDICDVSYELIQEAADLPRDRLEERLQEIAQHQSYRWHLAKKKQIMAEKRSAGQENIGLCLVCFDENFQEVFPFGTIYACRACCNNEK